MQYQLKMRETGTGQIYETEIPTSNDNDAHQYVESLSHIDGEWEIVSLTPVTQEPKRARCHYCGRDARPGAFGFFDEPVCRECGG